MGNEEDSQEKGCGNAPGRRGGQQYCDSALLGGGGALPPEGGQEAKLLSL